MLPFWTHVRNYKDVIGMLMDIINKGETYRYD